MTTLKPHIFIATCLEYEGENLDRLIKNIKELGNIPLEQVHIVSGGHPTDSHDETDGLTIDKVKYRAFEFTPFVYLLDNPEVYPFEYAFFTHDTVIFKPNFYNHLCNVTDYLKSHNYETARIETPNASMNIGVYHRSTIEKHTTLLNTIRLNVNDPETLWDTKHYLVRVEDKILMSAKHCNTFSENPLIRVDYNNARRVWVKSFNSWDIVKYQSNHNGIFSLHPPSI